MYAMSEQSNSLSPEQKLKVAKAIIILICLSAFVSNSYLLFSQFIQKSTVLSNDLITPDDRMLHAPSILVCGKTPFKNVQLDSKISDFEENSLKLEEFLVMSNFVSGNFTDSIARNITDEWLTFYTAYFGSCHKLELDAMVSKNLNNQNEVIELEFYFQYFQFFCLFEHLTIPNYR